MNSISFGTSRTVCNTVDVHISGVSQRGAPLYAVTYVLYIVSHLMNNAKTIATCTCTCMYMVYMKAAAEQYR